MTTLSESPSSNPNTDIVDVLQADSSGWFSRRSLVWAFVVFAVLAAAGAWIMLRSRDQHSGARYTTEPIALGNLVVSVSATGNLQPTNKVDVSSELSGIIVQVLVDENDRVKKGQLLAQLDLSRLTDAVTKSRAALAAAEAGVLQSQATMAEASAALSRFKQVSELSAGKVPSRSEMDAAAANLKRAEANESSARASVVQARANLQSDETYLAKAHIRSPIDGIVLTRKIEPGQTVAAALQAPVLFTLAEDLAKMELQVDVDEAEVGQVQVGQQATFTVDAWPSRIYTGLIIRVGYGSQIKDNVVTYPTVLEVKNDDLSLRPGMTGTAQIVTQKRENVPLVPNAALRFEPAPATSTSTSSSGGLVSKLIPGPPSQSTSRSASARHGSPRVWVLREGSPASVEIQTGVTNGLVSELLGGGLATGTPVITEAVGVQP